MLIVAALTAAAFVLRMVHIGDDLFGDELYTFDEVHRHGLAGLIDYLRHGGTEDNPPLFFVAAWGAAKLGPDTTWVRVPSLVAAVATVPVVYLLGLRTLGRRSGLAAAALLVVSPFATYYATEARAYALLMFMAAASTLLLVEAVRARRAGWWVAYGAVACATLYTHYTGVLVLAAQLLWVVWFARGSWRPAGVALGAAVVGYLPWVGTELRGPGHVAFAPIGPLSVDTIAVNLGRLVVGHPYRNVATVPGTGVALALALLVAGSALVALQVGWRDRSWSPPTASIALLALVAIVPIAGVLGYSLVRSNIFIARNLSASLPALAVLAGAALTALGGWRAAAAAVLAVALLGAGAIRGLDEEVRGSGGPDVAHYIEGALTPNDSIISVSLFGAGGAVERGPSIYFRRAHESFYTSGPGDDEAWRRAALRGGRVFAIYPAKVFGNPRRAGPGRCFREVTSRRWSTSTVGVYSLADRDRPCALRSLFPGGVGFLGFGAEERRGGRSVRSCTKLPCTIALANPSTTARRLTVSGALATPGASTERVWLRVGGRTTTIPATRSGARFSRVVAIRPRETVSLELGGANLELIDFRAGSGH